MSHFQKNFDEEYKARPILCQEGAVNINKVPFLKHNGKGKLHKMMASHYKVEIEGVEQKVSEAELDLDWMAQ